MVLAESSLGTLAAVLTTVGVMRLHLSPLSCREVVERCAALSCAAALNLGQFFLAVCFAVYSQVGAPLLLIRRLICCCASIYLFFVPSDVSSLIGAYLFTIRCTISCLVRAVCFSGFSRHWSPLILRASCGERLAGDETARVAIPLPLNVIVPRFARHTRRSL